MTGLRSGNTDQHADKPLTDSASSHIGVRDEARKMTTIVTIVILAEPTHRAIRIAQTVAVNVVETAIMAE